MKSPRRNEAFSHWARKMGSWGPRPRWKRTGNPSTPEPGRGGGGSHESFFWGGGNGEGLSALACIWVAQTPLAPTFNGFRPGKLRKKGEIQSDRKMDYIGSDDARPVLLDKNFVICNKTEGKEKAINAFRRRRF